MKKKIPPTLIKTKTSSKEVRLHFPDGERIETGFSVVVRGNGYSKVYRVERTTKTGDEDNCAILAQASPHDELLESHRRISKKAEDIVSDFRERNPVVFDLPSRKRRRDS